MSATYHQNDYPIVLYDSQCLICDTFVQWIIRMDEDRKLKFSGLLSDKAQYVISQRDIPMPKNDSVVLLYQYRYFTGPDAVIEILKILEKASLLIRVTELIPPSWRRTIYRWISRNRYRVFKKRKSCKLPVPADRKRFV